MRELNESDLGAVTGGLDLGSAGGLGGPGIAGGTPGIEQSQMYCLYMQGLAVQQAALLATLDDLWATDTLLTQGVLSYDPREA